jgi:hypothetical protein
MKWGASMHILAVKGLPSVSAGKIFILTIKTLPANGNLANFATRPTCGYLYKYNYKFLDPQ